MCSQFQVRTSVSALQQKLGLRVDSAELSWPEIIVPYQLSPVVRAAPSGYTLQLMQFSLIPPWSKVKRPRFASHNARLFSEDIRNHRQVPIYEKPAWKVAFLKSRCVVPLTHFLEPIYTGPYAGHWVRFSDHQDQELWVAGLSSSWTCPLTGEVVESFAMITDESLEAVRQAGHHRSPLFLRHEGVGPWLREQVQSPSVLMDVLIAYKHLPELVVEKSAPLKSGWEKRQQQKQVSLNG